MVHFEKQLFVLHIEDSASDSHLIESHLSKVGHKVYYERVSTRSEFFRRLGTERWNLIISDYFINGLSAIEALEAARDTNPDIAFILVSGRIGEESVADLMKAGVEDVVMKTRLERLVPVVRRILREHEIKDKEKKARVIASQAFAAKEQMLAIVSHDIKNPLSAIQLDAQMLIRSLEQRPGSLSHEEIKLQANRILKTTDRLKNLISDLLDKNKNDDGLASLNRVPVDPYKLIQEVVDSSRPILLHKEIHIVLPEVRTKTTILMDRSKMSQVLANLMSNAIKFSSPGGVIEISLEERKVDFQFSISDTGLGLSKEALSKVFEKYWTGGTGTGLGLFICKTIVEAHGGMIKASNRNEGGASFTFTLPKALSKQPHTDEDFSDHAHEKGIVVIDDDEDLREVICWALSKEGFEVKSFKNPQEAVDKLKGGSLKPDLIIVDYHMDGMKGGEFLELKNGITRNKINACPVVMISASPEEIESEVKREWYREIITKPIDLEGLVNKVKRNIS